MPHKLGCKWYWKRGLLGKAGIAGNQPFLYLYKLLTLEQLFMCHQRLLILSSFPSICPSYIHRLWMQLFPHFMNKLDKMFIECFSSLWLCACCQSFALYDCVSEKTGLHVHFMWTNVSRRTMWPSACGLWCIQKSIC